MNKVIQANLNHSKLAQDLIYKIMEEENVGVAIISEPYRVPVNVGWLHSGEIDPTVAVLWRQTPHRFLPTQLIACGEGYRF